MSTPSKKILRAAPPDPERADMARTELVRSSNDGEGAQRSSGAALVVLQAKPSLPVWPEAWYPVARSSDLPAGSVTDAQIAGWPFVVFRTERGELAALDAHCPHMGAHLRHAEVRGERLRCPLHHFTLGVRGDCKGGAGELRSRTWPVAERFGLVFVYAGEGGAPELPQPEEPDAYRWITAAPVELSTSWHAMMVNGFDLSHLRAVHHRALVEPPEITRPSPSVLQLRYTSRVTEGGGLADRVMRWIARDRIRVRQTCHGPTVVVESDLGRTKTAAVLGLMKDGDKVRAYGAFGARRGGFLIGLRLWVARWLFTAFLRKDFGVVEGMRLTVDGVDDPGVAAVASFLRSRPEVTRGG